MENKKRIYTENVVSDGKTESKITFYDNGEMRLSAEKITVDSTQEYPISE